MLNPKELGLLLDFVNGAIATGMCKNAQVCSISVTAVTILQRELQNYAAEASALEAMEKKAAAYEKSRTAQVPTSTGQTADSIPQRVETA